MRTDRRNLRWVVAAAAIIASAIIGGVSSPVSAAEDDMMLGVIIDTASGHLGEGMSWQPFIGYGDPDAPGSVVMNDAALDFMDCVNGAQLELTGDLASFNVLATDGKDQPLSIGVRVPGGTGSMKTVGESQVLTWHGNAPGVGSPDFHGYTVTRVLVMCSAFSGLPNGPFETITAFVVFGVPTAGGIIDQVDSFDLPKGLDNALKVKLEKVLEAVEDGDIDTACSELGAFVNQVEAQAGKKLTVEQAQELLDAAALLADQLGCP